MTATNVWVKSHHAGIQDVVYEVDDDSFSYQMDTELLPELPLVGERYSRPNELLQ